MSWKATQYVKELTECPDGARLSRGQKLLLFVLADYHNTVQKVAWPSLVDLASESLCNVSSVKRDLAYCEVHGVIRRKSGGGAGRYTTYEFVQLDGKQAQDAPFSLPETGAPMRPLTGAPMPPFCPEKTGAKQAHSAQETGAKQAHSARRNKEEPVNGTSTGKPASARARARAQPLSVRAARWSEENGYAYRDFCRKIEQDRQASVGSGARGLTRAYVLQVAWATGVPDHIALELMGFTKDGVDVTQQETVSA